MRKIFVSVRYLNHELICLGLMSEIGQKFYAESSEFSGGFPGNFTFCFEPPGPDEDEHWMWTKRNDVEMRGTNLEIVKNIKDWFQALSGGALSWVNYSVSAGGPGYRNIKPNIDYKDYVLYFKSLEEYNIFQSIWGYYPYPIINPPVILEELSFSYSEYPSLDNFTKMFHPENIDSPINTCMIIKSYVSTISNIKKSLS